MRSGGVDEAAVSIQRLTSYERTGVRPPPRCRAKHSMFGVSRQATDGASAYVRLNPVAPRLQVVGQEGRPFISLIGARTAPRCPHPRSRNVQVQRLTISV